MTSNNYKLAVTNKNVLSESIENWFLCGKSLNKVGANASRTHMYWS
jgi:hypothetical protein